MNDRKYYAHTKKDKQEEEWQELKEHLTNVSELAGKFSAKIGLEDCGKLMGILHDLGKYSDEFQKYLKSSEGLENPDEDDAANTKMQKGKIDHSTAGAQCISHTYANTDKKDAVVAQILSICLSSHHSNLIDCITPEGFNNFERRINKGIEKTHFNEVSKKIDEVITKNIQNILLKNEIIEPLFKKIQSLKDNIDNEETLLFKSGLLTRFLLSCLLDADRLDSADFDNPIAANLRNNIEYIDWSQLISRFNDYIKKFQSDMNENKINIIRQEISDQCYLSHQKSKGIFQLSVPTGGGKTLASLRFALNHAKLHNLERIIYIIPFTSIIDQNARIAREALEDKDSYISGRGDIVLEHHSNLTPEEETYKQKILSENWDSPVVFTTSVQFLEALFGDGTRSARRMHQLANAVLIFDEVQTTPIRCIHMFNVALRFLTKTCGSSIVLCTATQPLLNEIKAEHRRIELLPDHEIINDVGNLYKDLKRVDVFDKCKAGGWTENEVKILVEEEIKKTGSVLIIVNTKESARKLFLETQGYANTSVFHLSTDMCPTHRKNIFDKIEGCLLSKENIICISTQLIEAGVDIDFGSVIRYLAGLDSIAQAAGRCNRNGTRNTGNVYIINPAIENLNKLKDIKEAAKITERVLEEFRENPAQFNNDLLSPSAMNRFYKYYFFDRSETMKYPVGKNSKAGRNDDLFNLLSKNSLSIEAYKRINSQKEPVMLLRQAFKTAAEIFKSIDNSGFGVVVPYEKEGKSIINDLCSKENLHEQYRLLKRAQRFSINVFPYVFNELLSSGAIYQVQEDSGIYCLRDEYYSVNFGLSREPVNNSELNIV